MDFDDALNSAYLKSFSLDKDPTVDDGNNAGSDTCEIPKVNEAYVLNLLRGIITFDPRDIMKSGATGVELLPWDKIPKHARLAMKEISRTEDINSVRSQFVPHDRIKALELYIQYSNLFQERGRETDRVAVTKILLQRIQDYVATKEKRNRIETQPSESEPNDS